MLSQIVYIDFRSTEKRYNKKTKSHYKEKFVEEDYPASKERILKLSKKKSAEAR